MLVNSAETVGKLNTFEWPSNKEDLTEEMLTKNWRTNQVLSKLKVNT